MGEHKEKKHKERKHKEKKHKHKDKHKDKRKERKHKKKIEAEEEQGPHVEAAAAAVKLVGQPSEATRRVLSVMFNSTSSESREPCPDPPEALRGSRMKVRCPVDLQECRDGEDEEVWVIRLPMDVPVAALHGRTLHLPVPPPAARHLRPLQELLDDPTVDLLEHVRAHVRPQVIGHVRLGANEAAVDDLGQFHELLQEDETVAKRLRVLAPATGRSSSSSSHVQSCKVARLLSFSDDAWTEQRAMLSGLLEEAPDAAQQIGLDGDIPPRKFRQRLAGWKVLGKRPRQRDIWGQHQGDGGSSSGDDADDESGLSSSDEEFEEIVFGEHDGDRAAFSDDDGELSPCASQDTSGGTAGEGAAALDWDTRYYSSDSSTDDELLAEAEEEQEDEEEQQMMEVLMDTKLGVKEFLLSLPILADVAAKQAELYPSAAATLAAADSPGSPDASSGPQQFTSQWEQLSPPADYSPSTPAPEHAAHDSDSSDQQPHNKQRQQQAADMASDGIVSDDLEGSPADATGAGEDADAAIDWAALNESYGSGSSSSLAPPPPIAQLCQLGWAEEQWLAMLGLQFELQHFSRNYLVLFKLDLGDVAVQIDMERMSDEQVATLLKLLQLRVDAESADDAEEGEELQAQLLLPHKLHSRPHFTHTDQGYAPYQVADEPLVLHAERAEELNLDAAWAELLVARGAGRLTTLTDMEQLRARGFAWDSDPEEEQREGLHVTMPDGSTRHIPTGL